MKRILFFMLLVLLWSCSDDEEPVYRKLDAELISVYEHADMKHDFAFKISGLGDNTYECRLTTLFLRSVQNVESIEAELKDDKLTITVHTDVDAWLDELDRAVSITFLLSGLPSGTYRTDIYVDNNLQNFESPVFVFL